MLIAQGYLARHIAALEDNQEDSAVPSEARGIDFANLDLERRFFSDFPIQGGDEVGLTHLDPTAWKVEPTVWEEHDEDIVASLDQCLLAHLEQRVLSFHRVTYSLSLRRRFAIVTAATAES